MRYFYWEFGLQNTLPPIPINSPLETYIKVLKIKKSIFFQKFHYTLPQNAWDECIKRRLLLTIMTIIIAINNSWCIIIHHFVSDTIVLRKGVFLYKKNLFCIQTNHLRTSLLFFKMPSTIYIIDLGWCFRFDLINLSMLKKTFNLYY